MTMSVCVEWVTMVVAVSTLSITVSPDPAKMEPTAATS